MSSLVFLPASLCWWAYKKIIIIIITVWRIRGVSPKVGRICRKERFKAWNERVNGVMDDEWRVDGTDGRTATLTGESEMERLVRGWRRETGSWFQRREELFTRITTRTRAKYINPDVSITSKIWPTSSSLVHSPLTSKFHKQAPITFRLYSSCMLTNRCHRLAAVFNLVLFCSLAVLDPRVGHTRYVLSPFIPVPCHSDWLFHGESCPRLDVVHPGRA